MNVVPFNNMRKPGKAAELVEGRVRWGGTESVLTILSLRC